MLYLGLWTGQSLAINISFEHNLAVSEFAWFDTFESEAYSDHKDTSDKPRKLYNEENTELINEFVYFEFLPRYVNWAQRMAHREKLVTTGCFIKNVPKVFAY